MRALPLLALSALAFGQRGEHEILPEAIPHIFPVAFQDSEVLIGPHGAPVGFVEGVETLERYKPPLPERSKVTRIEYGLGPATNRQDFIIAESNEIDLIYQIFDRFSSKRTINRRYYRITEANNIEEVELGDPPRFEMHLCTNGFRFYSGEELLLMMDSHTDDETFFGVGFEFFNHPMVAFINYKIDQ